MKSVVADTGPINYLTLIGEAGVLNKLFQTVWLPPSVLAELMHPDAPPAVRAFASHLPPWCAIYPGTITRQDSLASLDPGEREAIELALQLPAGLLIDDAAGREAAIRNGVAATGTLAILQQASNLQLLDFEVTLNRLLETNFRVAPRLLARLRKQRKDPAD